MPSYKDDYPEKWLKAEHLQGKDVTITIANVTREKIFNRQTNQEEVRYAAHFRSSEKMFPLNKTNLTTMEEITGTDQWNEWKNVRVILRAKPTRLGDTIVLSKAAQAAAQVSGPNTPLTEQEAQRPSQPASLPVGAWPGDHSTAPQSTAGAPRAQSTVHGLEEDEDFTRQPPAEEEEEVHGPHYDKSQRTLLDTGATVEVKQEAFFSIVDLKGKIRDLENMSNGPMSDQQHAFVVHGLAKFSGREGELIMSQLLDKTVNTTNHAGEAVGKYLYELFRENGPYPLETQTLVTFIKDYLPKR